MVYFIQYKVVISVIGCCHKIEKDLYYAMMVIFRTRLTCHFILGCESL